MLTDKVRSWLRPIPRTHPFGEGVVCDGCDERLPLRLHSNGGRYCPRCSEEVEAVDGITPNLL